MYCSDLLVFELKKSLRLDVEFRNWFFNIFRAWLYSLLLYFILFHIILHSPTRERQTLGHSFIHSSVILSTVHYVKLFHLSQCKLVNWFLHSFVFTFMCNSFLRTLCWQTSRDGSENVLFMFTLFIFWGVVAF